MPLFGQSNPYMSRPHGFGLTTPHPEYLRNASYQIVPGPSGLPMAQVEMQFRRDHPPVTNPEMSLTLIIDRSGSMTETFREGHVANLVTTLYNYIWSNSAGAVNGFNLAFYDQYTTHAGFVGSLPEAQQAIFANSPRGLGTYAADALASSVKQYQDHRGMYIIVITDGEFADKLQVQNYIVQQLLPKLTPDNPYAFRLHFIGAGHEVDREFLEQLERAASGQGAPLVTQHHHAHLSHSHNTILDEMDKAYVGVSRDAAFGALGALAGLSENATTVEPDNLVSRCMDSSTRRSWHASAARIGFLPRHAILGCELAAHHASGDLPLAVRYLDANARQAQFTLQVPMPKSTAAAAPTPQASIPGIPARPSASASAPAPSAGTSLFGLKLPWLGLSAEDKAAREHAALERQELERKAQQNLIAEQQRQSQDLRELGRGGIPIMAVERLKEIGDTEGAIFTSDLTPEEAGLLRREGYRPLGMVTGSAMYHVGQAYVSATGDCEVPVLSDAYDAATHLAVDRMRQELKHIGGHGVVGVRLSLVRHEWADKTIEVQVVGTAVEGPGTPPSDPWMCDLSGQEWYALHRAGYSPAALVWGHATWFILTTQADEWNVRSWSNVELTHWSQALSRARHIALNKVKAQAGRHHGTGVAGVCVERRLDEVRLTGGEGDVYEREHHNLVVSILGTAIRVEPHAPTSVRPTVQMLSLRDGRLSPISVKEKDVAVE